MSDHKGDPISAPSEQSAPPVEDGLAELMRPAAGPGSGIQPDAEPDLEREALAAAEEALAEGERALAAARAQLQGERPTARQTSRPPWRYRGRELVLRSLLLVNVLAMIVVATLPAPPGEGARTPAPPAPTDTPLVTVAPPAAEPQSAGPRFQEPWNQALVAAERRQFGTAVRILEQYLTDVPYMAPSQKLSVLMALSHYAARDNDFSKSQEFQRRAEAIDRSHSLPEDLVAMAKAAAQSGDQEALRRVWARFLLQQRQIPSWLHKHVAEAYLQLGDSYRKEAEVAAERERVAELQATMARMREELQRREVETR